MQYVSVWLKGVKDIYTWETDRSLCVGARVVVKFRNRKKVGIVTDTSSQKPAFTTQPVMDVWDDGFLSGEYIELGKEIARMTFSNLGKVLSLMVPEKYLTKEYPEKREIFYTLDKEWDGEVKGKKQKEVLAILSDFNDEGAEESYLRDQGISLATIKGLLNKNIVQKRIGALQSTTRVQEVDRKEFTLTEDQERALNIIRNGKDDGASRAGSGVLQGKEVLPDSQGLAPLDPPEKNIHKPVLLWGVTGSGKTEVYKRLVEDVMQTEDGQVLILVPEIALTPQLISEFHAHWSGQVAQWHSRLSEGEKVQEWARIKSGEARILIGARSAVLVPMQNPKLIIVDEEHEWTYKNEFAPRFHTHDVVEMMGQKFNAKVVLGTATPKVESFLKSMNSQWVRVDIPNRVNDAKMPEISVVDMAIEHRKGQEGPLSEHLIESIQEMLANKKQGVLFLNKRGYYGATMCQYCGYTWECANCSQKMKTHRTRSGEKLMCHTCGRIEPSPRMCPECDHDGFDFRGWGTQMVEDELKRQFPNIRILRADADTTTGKHDFHDLLEKFHNYEADILLGTQMIAKGLDFDRVTLVGVVLADIGLGMPDFRSEERVYQLLTQVLGRAGRRDIQGEVIIQTFQKEHRLFQYLKKHDTEAWLTLQAEERGKLGFPPYRALVKITFSDVRSEVSYAKAKKFANYAEKHSDIEVVAVPAFFPRTHNKYHWHVLLKANKKEAILDFLRELPVFPVGVKVDIDPVSLL